MNLRLILVLLGFVAATASQAQTVNVSPFAGYRFGGSLQNTTTGNSMSIEDAMSYGIELDIDPTESGLKLSLLWSQQDTSLNLGSPSYSEQDLNVSEFMVGAIQELYDDKFRPYVGAYLGASYFDMPAYDDELYFGFGIVVGMNYYFTRNVGVNLGLRGFGTVVDSTGGFICADGVCLAEWSADVVWQGEVSGSIFISF